MGLSGPVRGGETSAGCAGTLDGSGEQHVARPWGLGLLFQRRRRVRDGRLGGAMKQRVPRAGENAADALVVRQILMGIREAMPMRIDGGLLRRRRWLRLGVHEALMHENALYGGRTHLLREPHLRRLAKGGNTNAQQEVEGKDRNQPSRHGGQIIRAGLGGACRRRKEAAGHRPSDQRRIRRYRLPGKRKMLSILKAERKMGAHIAMPFEANA